MVELYVVTPCSTVVLNILSLQQHLFTSSTLKTLDVLEGVISPGFDKDTTSYQVEVAPGITSLQMNIETTSNKAVYKVVGNSGFKVGENTVNIIVTAENGNKKTCS